MFALIKPLYDCYLAMDKRAGCILKLVCIKPPNRNLDIQKITNFFSDKTKLIPLNSQHNPLVKVFPNNELQTIANLVIKYDAYAVCAEVHEHVIHG